MDKENASRSIGEAFISGLIGTAFGLAITYTISLVFPTPWNISQTLLAVGSASFFTAFFASFYRARR